VAAPLHVSTQLDRTLLSESAGGEVIVQVDLASDAPRERGPRVPVNAVMILDRSGSMSGSKLERAKEAARALVEALGPDDSFSIVEFSNAADVVAPAGPATREAKAYAMAAISRIMAMGGTNLSSAFDLAGPQLSEGRAHGRVDKVFVASDGLANQGIFARPSLLKFALDRFGHSTVSTFGIGDDYDEQFMTQLAVQSGGRARYVANGAQLAQAFADEFSRASTAVAHDVRLDVRPAGGVRLERIIGFGPSLTARLPDVAAGEERRVLVKLHAPPGHGTASLAEIELTWRDASGAVQRARSSAQATYTADARSVDAQPANEVSWQAALSEMAAAAQSALRYQASNGPQAPAMARQEEARVQELAMEAARHAPPKAAQMFRAKAAEYGAHLSASGAGVQNDRKELSAKAADDQTIAVEF
jgi:Ca-activated chloride channel family protein